MKWFKQSVYGNPKTDKERLYTHFGQEKAEQMIEELGLEEAIKQLPPRGTRIQPDGIGRGQGGPGRGMNRRRI